MVIVFIVIFLSQTNIENDFRVPNWHKTQYDFHCQFLSQNNFHRQPYFNWRWYYTLSSMVLIKPKVKMLLEIYSSSDNMFIEVINIDIIFCEFS